MGNGGTRETEVMGDGGMGDGGTGDGETEVMGDGGWGTGSLRKVLRWGLSRSLNWDEPVAPADFLVALSW
jgi:hypothetical protein